MQIADQHRTALELLCADESPCILRVPEFRTIDDAIEALYTLNVGVIATPTGRHERPHKPLLLLSALDLIAEGRALPERIPWSQELRSRFSQYFEVVRRENDQDTPENPFFYLRNDGFWQPLESRDNRLEELPTTPTVTQARAGTVHARFTAGFEILVRTPVDRLQLRAAIVARYFPSRRAILQPMFREPALATIGAEPTARAAETPGAEPRAGRNPGFRRKVLEVYDYQCVACGLRIKLPDRDLTFVDGAHLVPFELTQNDHPSNGLALCKNHHWAMDRFLLVPTPERTWKVSPRLDARRSPGEHALLELHGQPLLPPHDDAFLPDPSALAWRTERLYA